MYDKTWMMRSPSSALFPMRRTDIVAPQRKRAVARVEQGYESPRSLPFITVHIDPTRTNAEGAKEIEHSRPFVLMRDAVGQVVGLRGPGRGRSGLRLQGGSLLEGEPQLIRPEGTGIEVKRRDDGGIASGLARVFGYSHRCWRASAGPSHGERP